MNERISGRNAGRNILAKSILEKVWNGGAEEKIIRGNIWVRKEEWEETIIPGSIEVKKEVGEAREEGKNDRASCPDKTGS